MTMIITVIMIRRTMGIMIMITMVMAIIKVMVLDNRYASPKQ